MKTDPDFLNMNDEERLAFFIALPQNEMAFQITQEHQQPGKTFSFEALNEFCRSIGTFIGARLQKQWQETGQAPTIAQAIVKVDFQSHGVWRQEE